MQPEWKIHNNKTSWSDKRRKEIRDKNNRKEREGERKSLWDRDKFDCSRRTKSNNILSFHFYLGGQMEICRRRKLVDEMSFCPKWKQKKTNEKCAKENKTWSSVAVVVEMTMMRINENDFISFVRCDAFQLLLLFETSNFETTMTTDEQNALATMATLINCYLFTVVTRRHINANSRTHKHAHAERTNFTPRNFQTLKKQFSSLDSSMLKFRCYLC